MVEIPETVEVDFLVIELPEGGFRVSYAVAGQIMEQSPVVPDRDTAQLIVNWMVETASKLEGFHVVQTMQDGQAGGKVLSDSARLKS